MDESRTVSVKLVLEIDKNAPRAFQQFARTINQENKNLQKQMAGDAKETATAYQTMKDKLFRTAGTVSQLGFNGLGGSLAHGATFAEGLNKSGFAGAAGFAQRAAIPLAVAGAAMTASTYAMNAANDKYSTNEQIGRRFVRDIVPGGEKIQNFVDAATGRAAEMEEADIQGQRNSARAQQRNEQAGFGLGFNPRAAGASALAGAYRGQSFVGPSVIDRSTAAGDRQFREEQRLLPLKQAQAKAERDAAVAVAERVATERESAKLSTRGVELTQQRAKLERDLDKDENASGASRQRVLRAIENTNQELGGNLSLQRQAQQAALDARSREAGSKGEREKARNAVELGGKASNLEDRAERGLATGSRLGAMNVYDRSAGVNAVKMALANPWDSLPPEIQQLALSVAPVTVGKLAQKAGLNSEANQELAKIAPEDAERDPSGLQRQAAELRREEARRGFDIDKTIADATAASFDKAGRNIAGIINEGLDRLLSEINKNVKLGRSATS